MDLDEYCWKKKKRLVDLAKKIGTTPATLSNIKTKKTMPSLLVAIKLNEITHGEVDFHSLLTIKGKEELNKWRSQYEKPAPHRVVLPDIKDDESFEKFKENYLNSPVSVDESEDEPTIPA